MDSWPGGRAASRSWDCGRLKMSMRLGRRAGFSDRSPVMSPTSSGLYLPGAIARNCPAITRAFKSAMLAPSKGTLIRNEADLGLAISWSRP